jgi:hypothetical protein
MFVSYYGNEHENSISKWYMLFHDEELDEEELSKCFKKMAPETLDLIRMEYTSD